MIPIPNKALWPSVVNWYEPIYGDKVEGQVLKEPGTKYDAGKPRMDLLDSYAIEQLAEVLTFGATKYDAHNWRGGIKFSRIIAAILRHIFSFLRGETIDPESGLHHIAHAMCGCMFLLGLSKTKPECDDRYAIHSTES